MLPVPMPIKRDLDAGLAQRNQLGRTLGQSSAASRGEAGAAPDEAFEAAAITAVVAAAVLTMKSRRFTWPVMTSISRVWSVVR